MAFKKKHTEKKERRVRERDERKKATKKKQEKEKRKSTRENGAKRGGVAHDVSFQSNENSVDDATQTFPTSPSSTIVIHQRHPPTNVYTGVCVCDVFLTTLTHFDEQLHTRRHVV